MTRHEEKEAMEMAGVRQAVAGLDATFRDKVCEAIRVLDKLEKI